MQKILHVNPGEHRRIVVISDIHGAAKEFAALLDMVSLAPEDILVLNGDYINCGPESAEVVRRVMELAARPNTYVLKGNIERLVPWYLDWGKPEDILPHFDDHVNNLFCEWAAMLGKPRPKTPAEFLELRPLLRRQYAKEAQFLHELPLGLAMGDLIFVHAGIAPSENWEESSEQTLLKNDPFLAQGENKTGKWVIVGHMPVWNVPFSENSNNPSMDAERKIIGIDGGNQVKDFSQLNALIIEKQGDMYEFSYQFADLRPKVRAKTDFAPMDEQGCFKDSWPDFYLDVLERGPEFSLCRRTVSQVCGLVKNEHIGLRKGLPCFAKSSVSTLLAVSEGEELFYLDEGGSYTFVKNADGFLGWVPSACLEK